MIDIHSHIIPGIDDGAQNMKEAVAMAEAAYENGTYIMAATPHFMEGGSFSNYYGRELTDSFNKLKEELLLRKIPLELKLGMEIYYSGNVSELLRQGWITGLNQTKYILVEFDFSENLYNIYSGIQELIESGYIPVIAHPERYPYVQNRVNLVYEWIQSGCLIQIDTGSALGRFGKKAQETSFKLLTRKMVHVIASDSHDRMQRGPSMLQLYGLIRSEFGQKYAGNIFELNPGLILKDEAVPICEPVWCREKKRFTMFREE
ncbi:MAG: CpsB/CapC family capsule biosynthesis tyrosine phosphatase [Clostridiaceae bacterium]